MTATIEQAVRDKYGAVASSSLSNTHAGVQAVAKAFGYTAEELASIPAEANMGLSCGNPTATAHLKAGEVVVDLGCGGGLDVFLAAQKVGPAGKAIGIDMTPAMLERARQNAAKEKLQNVEFHQAMIDHIPLDADTVDCIISNCVINLAPDKPAVFREMYRVLKPGGRLAISDIALKKPLPEEIGQDLMAYIGCIAGAISLSDYMQGLQAAGFSAVQIVDTHKDLNAYGLVEGQSACCAPPMNTHASLNVLESGCCGSGSVSEVHESLLALLQKYNVNDYAASVQVYAVKASGE
ncbi:MAG: arsenite methyltransferase [Gemmatales bacterium]